MDDLVYIPGESKSRKIVGIDHANHSFIVETTDNEDFVHREEVSLQRLRLYQKPHNKKLRLSPSKEV
jgi:hypothetical protein